MLANVEERTFVALTVVLLPVVWVLWPQDLRSQVVEPGDADGDGQLSIGDVAWLTAGGVPAPGSLDAYDDEPCLGDPPNFAEDARLAYVVAPNLMMEVARRAVPGSLPHWDPALDPTSTSTPLAPDPSVKIRMEDVTAPGGLNDQYQIILSLENSSTITHFMLLLDADESILRFKWMASEAYSWGEDAWRKLDMFTGDLESTDNIRLAFGPGPSLITRGKLCLTFGFRLKTWDIDHIDPGTHVLVINMRLPLGTKAGKYGLRVLATSQVRLEDGTVVAPTVEEGGELTVEEEVQVGWDEGPVPLRIDPDTREVLGDIEFRVVDERGNSGDDAIFEGQVGDEIRVRAQIRTEVPLNHFQCALSWPPGKLGCDRDRPLPTPKFENLFTNPEDGELYPFSEYATGCESINAALRGSFILPGYQSWSLVLPSLRYSDRLLDYFKPLGEWSDLFEVTLTISDSAVPGEEIPLELLLPLACGTPFPPGSPVRYSCSATFYPYSTGWPYPCVKEMWPDDCKWHYPGLKSTGAKVHVLDGPPPPPPPDYDILFSLDNASGNPGDLVEVPIYGSASDSLGLLRLALEIDPAVATVESIALRVTSSDTFEDRTELVSRGEHPVFTVCHEEDLDGDGDLELVCRHDIPFWALIHDTDPQYFVLDLHALTFGYPGSDPTLIGTLNVRIASEPAAGEAFFSPARLSLNDAAVPFAAETGGMLLRFNAPDRFSPGAVESGKITVLGFEPRRFVRGDANGDQKVDLSDAVATLGYLFLGNGELPCLKAADSDDSGVIEITDTIFLLGYLFLGQRSIPEPYPACGLDPSPDLLGCRLGCP